MLKTFSTPRMFKKEAPSELEVQSFSMQIPQKLIDAEALVLLCHRREQEKPFLKRLYAKLKTFFFGKPKHLRRLESARDRAFSLWFNELGLTEVSLLAGRTRYRKKSQARKAAKEYLATLAVKS